MTDIDCVAIGPGGILAVSTKWTANTWDLSDRADPWVRAAAGQAAFGASRLLPEIRHHIPDPPIIPVVVC